MRSKVGPPKEIRESEKVVDEKVTRRTEEYLDEVTGERRVRTVEYVEKLIERQVLLLLKLALALESSTYLAEKGRERERARITSHCLIFHFCAPHFLDIFSPIYFLYL